MAPHCTWFTRRFGGELHLLGNVIDILHMGKDAFLRLRWQFCISKVVCFLPKE